LTASKFRASWPRCTIPATTPARRKRPSARLCRGNPLDHQQICPDWVDTYPADLNNFCCGAGGGAWAMPYSEERIYYGRKKAEQIKQTGAEIVVAPCHNCRDQIMKSLTKEYDLDIETFYLWELLAESIMVEPWSPSTQQFFGHMHSPTTTTDPRAFSAPRSRPRLWSRATGRPFPGSDFAWGPAAPPPPAPPLPGLMTPAARSQATSE
jgi:hypothetical protein